MSKKNFLFGIIFIFIGFYSFACPHLNDKNPGWCEVARVFMNDTLPELNGGKVERGERIKGVVYFEGFDFVHYDAESKGIEPMLAETYVLLLAWCEIHKDELLQNWELATKKKDLRDITPLV